MSGPFEPEIIDVAGTPTPVTSFMGERQVSADEWGLAYCVSGATLRAACQDEGLSVSGTNADRARRIVAKGLTRVEVEQRYGWRARRGG